jgi:hypothetical protein
MRPNTTIHGGQEVAGTKFFTWAIIAVAAGLLVAMTTDITFKQTAPVPAHTVQTSTDKNAS